MQYFDSHCHLQMQQFDIDREAALLRMQEKQVGGIVVGTDYETSKAACDLVEAHNFLWAAVGLHPNDNLDEHFDISKYEALAKNPKVVAIGECGLDYYRSGKTGEERDIQKKRFEAQIQLSLFTNKPLIIHCRDAHEDCSSILQKTNIVSKVPVIIHFFTGTAELAQKYLDLGCHLSFPGPITYTDMYDESIRVAPLEKILSETDSPFAAPVPHRSKRNEPIYIKHIVEKIAVVKSLSADDIATQILRNSLRIFNIDK